MYICIQTYVYLYDIRLASSRPQFWHKKGQKRRRRAPRGDYDDDGDPAPLGLVQSMGPPCFDLFNIFLCPRFLNI